MKAGIFMMGSGPIMVLTSYATLQDSYLVSKFLSKGIKKFIAFEIDLNLVKERYGNHFNVVMGDLHQSDDLRVLDYDGHHIFDLFHFSEFGEPVYNEME